MPSLERFFDPQMRKFDANVRPLPGARLYFFENGTTTPKTTYKDKQGSIGHDNPVIADSTGVFPQIFLDGLYRVELRSSSNIVQPGWPIDNIGQDTPVVPFGPWIEINTYNTGEVVTGSNGNWYRSITDNNLGNDPISSPSEWEVIPIPVASSFTSNKAYLTWTDDGDQVSLNVDTAGLVDEIEANLDQVDGDLAVAGELSVTGDIKAEGGLIQVGDAVGTTAYINNESEISENGTDFYKLINANYFSAATLNTITATPSGGLTSAVLNYWVIGKVAFGVIKSQCSSDVLIGNVGTLPVGHRPAVDNRYQIAGEGRTLDIETDGDIIIVNVANTLTRSESIIWVIA